MAAPFAAGVAALVQAHNPQFAPVQTAQQIVVTAARIGGETPLRIDAAAALGVAAAVNQPAALFMPSVQSGAAENDG